MIAKTRLVASLASLMFLLTACQEKAPEPTGEKAKAESPGDERAQTPPEPVADTPQVAPASTPDGTAPIAEQGDLAAKPSQEVIDKQPEAKDEAVSADGPTPVKHSFREPPDDRAAPMEEASDLVLEEAPAAEAKAASEKKYKLNLAPSKREERAKRVVSSKTVVGMVGANYGAGGLGSGAPGAGPGFAGGRDGGLARVRGIVGPAGAPPEPKEVPGTEDYEKVDENPFKNAMENPLSTFSIDVDTASYANARRFIDTMGRLPPADAVRIEEFINYFSYDYPAPAGETPFSVTTEVSVCPWNSENRMVLVGLQGKKPPEEDLPPSNLVFLIDSSGSMRSAYKMPLLKKGFQMLVGQLSAKDRVAIVVYAGSAGIVLPSTKGTERRRIITALERLRAGGSTAGAAGIQLAYQVARENFIEGGNNRVILATDGDFNVGAASNAELERIIEEKRDEGVFLTVLGFGMGNYKDSRMETLADKGNGNYGYIDNILEAKKVFVTQMTGTLFTIAKDVKIQVEFNPAKVKSYRLVGYENRILAKEDFADDKKDAGELGAGHTVTALYEIVPAEDGASGKEELRYVKTEVKDTAATTSELMTVKLRYKMPDGDTSTKLEQPVLDQGVSLEKTSDNYRFAASVAMFGMLLRKSTFVGNTTYGKVLEMARGARGNDDHGYRAEFIKITEKAELIAPSMD